MDVIIIAHNIRSTYNVGSIFRTADGFGVKKIIFSGYTPYPKLSYGDTRLPYIIDGLTKKISKTALGAEKMVDYVYQTEPDIANLRKNGYRIIALEQDKRSVLLNHYNNKYEKIALLLGEEVHGINSQLLDKSDDIVEIPMFGQKESFNVSVATAICLYGLILTNK